MRALCFVAALIVAMPALAQDLSLPADAPKNYNFNKRVVSLPGESCTSQNDKCVPICRTRNDMDALNSCMKDCAARIEYCRKSGYYLWIQGPSVQVGTK